MYTGMRWNRHMVYDVLHKTVVTGLIGFSVLSAGWLSYKAAYYYIYKRPLQAEMHRKTMEEKIAMEQALKETELMKQSEKEILR
jgi:hypothetical protein